MATITRTFTENVNSSYKSTWTLTFTGVDQTVSDNFYLTAPTITAKYVYSSGKNLAQVGIFAFCYIGGYSGSYRYREYTRAKFTDNYTIREPIATTSGTTYTIARDPIYVSNFESAQYTLSDYFNSSNATVKTLNIYLQLQSNSYLWSGNGSGVENAYNFNDTTTNIGVIGTITLNAPPTFTGATQTTGPYYQYVNPYTASVANLSAKYGGTISEVKLTIGSQTVTRSNAGTLTITPNVAGTFTPVLTVTDSRGQSSSLNLNPITVIANVVGVNNVSADRVDTTGILSDEGLNAVIPLTLSYTELTGNYLAEPTLTVDGNTPSNIIWYANWTASGGFSSPINWTNYAPSSPVTIYGWVKDTLSDSASHEMAVKVASTYAESNEITFTLSQAFFLLVGRPGGKGLGIGMKPTSDDCWLGMDIKMYLDQSAQSGADYDLIQALTNIGWSDLI